MKRFTLHAAGGVGLADRIRKGNGMTEDRCESHCPRCYGRRERRVDLETGQYLATFPRSCPTKDICEREIMAGYNIVAHGNDGVRREAERAKDDPTPGAVT